jgi:hypothetical protein
VRGDRYRSQEHKMPAIDVPRSLTRHRKMIPGHHPIKRERDGPPGRPKRPAFPLSIGLSTDRRDRPWSRHGRSGAVLPRWPLHSCSVPALGHGSCRGRARLLASAENRHTLACQAWGEHLWEGRPSNWVSNRSLFPKRFPPWSNMTRAKPKSPAVPERASYWTLGPPESGAAGWATLETQ